MLCAFDVFPDAIFFQQLENSKGHLVSLYTVHQSMHKGQLVFLSHCLKFFSVFIKKFYTDWFIDGQFYIRSKQYSTLPKIHVALLQCVLTLVLCNWTQGAFCTTWSCGF